MALGTGLDAILLLVGRILFGGLLLVGGLNHFLNASEMTAMADSKGVPVASAGVFASGALLTLGGLGILLGVYPRVAAGMLTVFFLAVTPMMHNFWAISEEDQQTEMAHFLKNIELLGASLVFFALGGETWAYALNIGL